MISLTCANCRAVLKIDDAFAGGVCRCQHCGTIQTVPSRLKSSTSDSRQSKALYRRSARGAAAPSSGLDEPAGVVAGSGLISARFGSLPPRKTRTLLIAGGAAVALAIAIAVWLVVRGSDTPANTGQPQQAASVQQPKSRPQAGAAMPDFCGLALNGAVVVYVLDRGSGTVEWFGHLKEACYRSAESLGSSAKFQIIFWNNGGADDAFPNAGPTYATPQNVESARRALENIHAHGQTTVASALRKAIGSDPDLIVLATGKAWQLDDSFVQEVMSIRGEKTIPIHTVSLGGDQTSPPLRAIAQQTGGQTIVLSEGQLKAAAR